MTVHIARAGIQDADTIAAMVGDLLHNIMAGSPRPRRETSEQILVISFATQLES